MSLMLIITLCKFSFLSIELFITLWPDQPEWPQDTLQRNSYVILPIFSLSLSSVIMSNSVLKRNEDPTESAID